MTFLTLAPRLSTQSCNRKLLCSTFTLFNFLTTKTCTGPTAHIAQKQKSLTTKSPLMQDWVFRLGSRYFLGKMFCFSVLVVHIYFVLSINLVILQIVSHFRIILELMVIRVNPLNAGNLVPTHFTSKCFIKTNGGI